MNMIDRRSKMISFRLSPEEYSQLREACVANGVRSVSELARTSMHGLIVTNKTGVSLYVQMQELRDRVTLLTETVDRLSRQVEPAQMEPLQTGAAAGD